MLDFLQRAIAVDNFTLVIAGLLSGWAGVLTMQVLPRALLGAIITPFFGLGALITNYCFELIGLQPTSDRETNIIVGCTAGLIAAMLVIFLLLRVSSTLAGLRAERYQFKRDMRSARHA